MSFFRKLFGSGEPPPDPPPPDVPPPARRIRTTASSPPQPLAELNAPPPPSWEPPPGPRRTYLEYVGGASSKFYAITLTEDEDDRWTVRFNYGRIGFPRAWAPRVELAPWSKALAAWQELFDEKQGKGYEFRPWPGYLKLPDGATLDAEAEAAAGSGVDPTLFRASRRGALPPVIGGSIAGVQLPDGRLESAGEDAGSRGDSPLIWTSLAPVANVARTWATLAAAFPETGVWPLVIDAKYGFKGFGDYLQDVPRGRHKEVAAIIRRGWNASFGDEDEDEEYLERLAPFGRPFPGLAAPTPGARPASIDSIVAHLDGHLGLVAVNRPADVLDAIGWGGAMNYDGDPLDMSTVLRSWEVRFDAYLVSMSTDTLALAVGRPPRDLASATAIAAEHYAFCPDNIDQGADSIEAYAPLLVNEPLWPFWWD